MKGVTFGLTLGVALQYEQSIGQDYLDSNMVKTVGVYIDGANLHKGSIELGHVLDYKKFRGWLWQKFGAETAYLFLGLIPKHTKLYQRLQECGYILIFKETVTHGDGQIKGNCDAELVVKVMSDFYEKAFDEFVLITGDGDFRCLVDFLIDHKAPVSIMVPNKRKCSILLKRTDAPMIDLADHYKKFSLQKEPKNEKAPDRDVSL